MGLYKPVLDAEALTNWFSRGRAQSKKPPTDIQLIAAIKASVEHEMKLGILYASEQGTGHASLAPLASLAHDMAPNEPTATYSPHARPVCGYESARGRRLPMDQTTLDHVDRHLRAEIPGPAQPVDYFHIDMSHQPEEYGRLVAALPPADQEEDMGPIIIPPGPYEMMLAAPGSARERSSTEELDDL